MNVRFRSRVDAGRRLAERLAPLPLTSPLVLGLPRGGVPVAAQVAAELGAPLEVMVACKVGAPGYEELGIGAVAEGLDRPLLSEAARQAGVTAAGLDLLADDARAEMARRVNLYRGDRRLTEISQRDVVVVDDGLATGVTAEAALVSLRICRPRRLILGVPVASRAAVERLGGMGFEVICLEVPDPFYAVGEWYDDFSQTTDEEVLELLGRLTGPRSDQ